MVHTQDGSSNYAGFLAEFSSTDGSLLPVPSKFVPNELIMWGQAPTTLEVLVSEQTITKGTDSSSEQESELPLLFRRHTIVVLPAVGCGLDSLDTNRSEEIYNLGTSNNDCETKSNAIILDWKDETNGIGVMNVLMKTAVTKASAEVSSVIRKLRLETTFSLPRDHRLRVSFELHILCYENGTCRYELPPSSSIKLQWERRYDYDTNPESAMLAANVNDRNGHLDAGTVFALIGEDLRQQRSQLSNLGQQTLTGMSTNNIPTTVDTDSSMNLKLVEGLQISTSRTGTAADVENGGECWHLDMSLDMPHLPKIDLQAGDNNNEKLVRTVRRSFRGWHCEPAYFRS